MRNLTRSFAEGTSLWKICEILIKNAPAKAIHNGILIVAKNKSTKLDDIYCQYFFNRYNTFPSLKNWKLYQSYR